MNDTAQIIATALKEAKMSDPVHHLQWQLCVTAVGLALANDGLLLGPDQANAWTHLCETEVTHEESKRTAG